MSSDDIIRMAQDLFRKHMKQADQVDPMRIRYSTTQHENAGVCVVALAISEAERERAAMICHQYRDWSDNPAEAIAEAILRG